MPGQFVLVGKIEPSHTGHSFKVFILSESGEWVFLGLVSKNSILALVRQAVPQADISKYETEVRA